VHRGWVAVDVACDADTVRIVSTHLDPDAPPVQLAQARELTAGPVAALGPLVLIGDFNTWPDERGRPTYEHLRAAGFADAWSAVGQGSGLTHGHAPDLRNAEARFTARLDLVLLRGAAVAHAARLTGHEPRGRTPSGLWPSDHAGVVVQVEVG
jgi:endonuclease/exonuclease/phosphatase family metal-dependent hydrolase